MNAAIRRQGRAHPPMSLQVRVARLRDWATGRPSRGRASSGHFRLLRHFSIASALVMLAVTVVLVHIYRANQKASLLSTAEDQNAALARSFANTVLTRHAGFLGSVAELSGDELRARPETADIHRELKAIANGLPVLKIKIFNVAGKTLYSSEAKQIGDSKSSSPGFRKAVASRHPVSTTSFRGAFDSFDGMVANVDLAESYVPIVDGSNRITFVFELYTDITAHVSRISRDRWLALLLAGAASVVVYLGLLLIVRRADRILERQQSDLIDFSTRLEVARATTDLNAELKSKVLQLERSNQELEEFAKLATHDLQEPMRKIEIFADRLTEGYRDALAADGRGHLDRICQSARRMRQLIGDIRTYSQVESVREPFVEFDMGEVVAEVLERLQVGIREAEAEIRVGTMPRVLADPTKMSWLLAHLLANAVKFCKPSGTPIITCAAAKDADGSLVLEIADNGVGFDNAYRDRLFRVFQRLDKDREGTGIGLAICRKIAEYHGGAIDIRGVPDQGATVTVRMPILAGDARDLPRVGAQRSRQRAPRLVRAA